MKHLEQLANEIQTAREKYGPFNSTHEVYGVLVEEVAEFFEYVKQKPYTKTDSERAIKENGMVHELLQIAAISLRAIDELEHDQIKWV